MIIDKIPIVAPQTNGSSSTSPPPTHDMPNPSTGPASPGVPEQSPRMSDAGHPDYAPPPYETVVATSSPRASTRRLSKRAPSTSSGPSSPSIGGLDLIVQDKARICPRNPTEHISPSFLRPVPSVSESTTTYERLPRPFVIDSKPGACTLEDSFATVGTPALYKHDVSESDWEELLGDVQVCSRLSPGQRVVLDFLPVARHLGPPGYLASYMAEQGMNYQKMGAVVALLDLWNEKFFKPRRLEVILCRGDKRKSGRDIGFLAPDRMDGPAVVPKQKGRCCHRSRCCRSRQQAKPYRLVVVSI